MKTVFFYLKNAYNDVIDHRSYIQIKRKTAVN